MASAQVVETSVNTNNSPSQDNTTNPDDHSNHNIDAPGFKPFTVIFSDYDKSQTHDWECPSLTPHVLLCYYYYQYYCYYVSIFIISIIVIIIIRISPWLLLL